MKRLRRGADSYKDGTFYLWWKNAASVRSTNIICPYVIGVTTDMERINSILQLELQDLGLRMVVYTFVTILILYTI